MTGTFQNSQSLISSLKLPMDSLIQRSTEAILKQKRFYLKVLRLLVLKLQHAFTHYVPLACQHSNQLRTDIHYYYLDSSYLPAAQLGDAYTQSRYQKMYPLLRWLQYVSTHLCQLTALRADYTLRYLTLCILLITEDLSRAYEGKTYTGMLTQHKLAWETFRHTNRS